MTKPAHLKIAMGGGLVLGVVAAFLSGGLVPAIAAAATALTVGVPALLHEPPQRAAKQSDKNDPEDEED